MAKKFVVIETCSGESAPRDRGGFPTFHETIEEAVKKVASIVSLWDVPGLKRGVNDGEKWADLRYDDDGELAFADIDGTFRCAEVHEIPQN